MLCSSAKARADMRSDFIGRALRCGALSRRALWRMGGALWVFFAVVAMPPAFAEEFLDPEEAFQLSAASVSPTEDDVYFKIAPEYYMYQERFAFATPGSEVDT